MSDFNQPVKPDHLQFFGTTDCKIAENNFVKNKFYDVGPGTYATGYENSFKGAAKRANTTQVSGTRRDV